MKTMNSQSASKGTQKKSIWLVAALALTLSFTSCNKDEGPGTLSLQNELAPLPSSGTVNLSTSAAIQGTITRVAAAPSAPAHYRVNNFFVDQGITAHPDSIYHRPNGSYFFDLSTGDVKTVSDVTSPSNFDLEFTGTGNAYIKRHSTVTARAVNGTSFNAITLSHWATATAINTAVSLTGTGAGFGHDGFLTPGTPASNVDPTPATITGWANYWFDNHEILPITNRILLFEDALGNIFAFEFQSIYQNSNPIAIAPSSFPNNYSYLNFRFKKLN